MRRTEKFDLSFRPDTYWSGAREIDYPIRAEAPLFGGGSYLPRLAAREVEIAGVALASTTGDVISVRARPVAEGIRFRVVDEYRTRFKVVSPIRSQPLTLGELVEMMDTVEFGGGVGMVESFLDLNWVGHDPLYDPGDLREFVLVVSPFYRQLERLYDRRAELWVRRRRREQRVTTDSPKP